MTNQMLPSANMLPKQPPDSVKGCDPALIEDPAPYTVEMSRYQKYGASFSFAFRFPRKTLFCTLYSPLSRQMRAAFLRVVLSAISYTTHTIVT